MRVVHVAECVGGVERYLRSLLKYSSCENIMILSQLYNKAEFENLADSVEIVSMSHNIGISALKEAIQIRKKIKKYKPDIVWYDSFSNGIYYYIASICR